MARLRLRICVIGWQQHEAPLAVPAELATGAATLTAAAHRLVGVAECTSARFGIAVSGGPDSVALLLIAHLAFPGRIEAATVDHRLRAASADEAQWVGAVCADRGIPHTILTPATPISGNIQSQARAVRYALLEQWRIARGIDWLMTAHHADDQLETLVMRLNRSSGIAGLAGIRSRQGHVLRPLLTMRHDELVAIVCASGLQPVDDPSNRDHRFDRVKVRAALATCDLVDATAAQASVEALGQADAAIGWMVERLAEERLVRTQDSVSCDMDGLPQELVRRLLLLALTRLQAKNPTSDDIGLKARGGAITRAIDALTGGESAMLGDVLIRPSGPDGTIWRFDFAPPRRRAPSGKRAAPC